MQAKDQTTKNIALVLLWGFVGVLVILLVVNLLIYNLQIGKDPTLKTGWFELLKNYLILLGSALTTVIGYYFGQREGAIKAEQAKEKILETDKKAQMAVSEAFRQRDDAIKDAGQTHNDVVESDEAPAEETDTIKNPLR